MCDELTSRHAADAEAAADEARFDSHSEMARMNLDVDEIMSAAMADTCLGFCVACGAEKGGCEPDAREYCCDDCGAMAVYGAEELLIMIG